MSRKPLLALALAFVASCAAAQTNNFNVLDGSPLKAGTLSLSGGPGAVITAATGGSEILLGTSTVLGAAGNAGFRANGTAGGFVDLLVAGTRTGAFYSYSNGTNLSSLANNLFFGIGNPGNWIVQSTGQLGPVTDGGPDIGTFGGGGPGRPGNIYVTKTVFTTAPNTQTGATYTVAATDNTVRANLAGTMTLTLPAVATSTGRKLRVVTLQAQTVVSASSNVTPIIGGAAGTAILAATAGKWADLECDGATWIITASN